MATKKGATSGMGSVVARATARARAKNNITPGMVNQGPLYTEHRPEPANVPPTGTEHLSGAQFPNFAANPVFPARSASSPMTSSMHPGGFRAPSPPPTHTPYGQTRNMHPGGSSPIKPKSSAGYIPGGGNTVASGKASPNVNAPKESAGSAYWSGLGMGGSAQPRVRGNPDSSAYNPGSSKGKRSAMQVGLSRGSSKGKIRLGWPRKSPHEGMNARHLAKSTGA